LILPSFSADPKTSFMFIYGFLVISIPLVAFTILWIIYEDIKHKIKISGKTAEIETEQEPLFKLTNDKGKTLVEVNLKDVVCFEANDNYVVIYHLNASDELEKSMQRISLKKVENLIQEIPIDFKRVHKSYLINPTHIDKIDGKAQAYRIQMKHFDKEVPVSRNFKISDISG
jgi:DNA-binding LytR/AlgR family response regulator